MLDGVNEPAHGNAQVIKLLEHYLEKAKQGRVNYGFVGVTLWPDVGDYDVAGTTEMEHVALVTLDMLRQRIENDKINRLMPERDPNCSADMVCYDVAAGSVSYDFMPWLIDAEMTRLREGAPAPLKVAFWFGRNGATGINTEYRAQMLNNVMRPLLGMIGAVEDKSAVRGRNKGCIHYQDIVPAYLNGEEVRRFQPSERERKRVREFLGDREPVTITLRESGNWLHRNSSIPEWIKFAKWLEDRGELVVFVRDTAKAEEPMPGFITCPRASIDIDMRCALYESAKCNLFVSNGPHCLALFGNKPWLMFIEINEDDPFPPHRSEWWRESCGIHAGEQFPWCDAKQRITWKRDTFENMVEAWELYQDNELEVAA